MNKLTIEGENGTLKLDFLNKEARDNFIKKHFNSDIVLLKNEGDKYYTLL